VTRFLLVRHGDHDLLGRALAGRAPVCLNERGRVQAAQLVQRLAATPPHAIYCSPQLRARETAEPLAARAGLPMQVDPAFDEIDFGRWTGLSFERLRDEGESWRTWVERRSIACPPGGEPFAMACQRAMAGIERLQRLHPEETLLLVSHGDIVKAILASFLGMSLDHLQRFEIEPASLSVVLAGAGWYQVKLVNGHGAAPA
jgi:broad specificity phosphatase PhoE